MLRDGLFDIFILKKYFVFLQELNYQMLVKKFLKKVLFFFLHLAKFWQHISLEVKGILSSVC